MSEYCAVCLDLRMGIPLSEVCILSNEIVCDSHYDTPVKVVAMNKPTQLKEEV